MFHTLIVDYGGGDIQQFRYADEQQAMREFNRDTPAPMPRTLVLLDPQGNRCQMRHPHDVEAALRGFPYRNGDPLQRGLL